MVPFKSLAFYSNHGSMLHHFRDKSETFVENRSFSYSLNSTIPLRVSSRQNIAKPFGTKELELCGYRTVRE